MDAPGSVVLLGLGGPAWKLATLGFSAGAAPSGAPPRPPAGLRARRATAPRLRAARARS